MLCFNLFILAASDETISAVHGIKGIIERGLHPEQFQGIQKDTDFYYILYSVHNYTNGT